MRFLPLRSLLLLPCLALIGIATIGLAGCGSSDGDVAVPQPKHIAYISELGDEGNMKRLLPTHAKDFVEIGLYRQAGPDHRAAPVKPHRTHRRHVARAPRCPWDGVEADGGD